MDHELNLTSGGVLRGLARFSLPLLLSNLLQSLYSVVDMLVVGRFVGENGLAAISNASGIGFLMNSVCIGFTMGGTVLVAQCKGARDPKGRDEAVGALLAASLGAAALVTLAGLAAYEPALRLLRVPPAAMKEACGYLRILCWGTVFVFGYNAVCSILKGLGDARGPLRYVAVATVLNIALDLLLVGLCGMGTAGAAAATVASQGASFAFAIADLRRRGVAIRLRRGTLRPGTLRALLLVGLPTAAQMAAVNLSYLALTGMLNGFGVAVAAASGIGLKINTFAGMPCWAVGQAVTAMAGQNFGAGETARVQKTVRAGLALNLAVTSAAVLLVQAFAGPAVALFDPSSAEVARVGVQYLRTCCSVNSLVYAAMYTFDSFAIGIGSARLAMVNALLDAAVVRVPLGLLLAFSLGLGYPGIFLAQALSPVLPALVGLLYWRRGAWKLKIPARPAGLN